MVVPARVHPAEEEGARPARAAAAPATEAGHQARAEGDETLAGQDLLLLLLKAAVVAANRLGRGGASPARSLLCASNNSPQGSNSPEVQTEVSRETDHLRPILARYNCTLTSRATRVTFHK